MSRFVPVRRHFPEREATNARDKMDRDGSISRSTPKLEVFAPQSFGTGPSQREPETRQSCQSGKKQQSSQSVPSTGSEKQEDIFHSVGVSQIDPSNFDSDEPASSVDQLAFSAFGAVAALPSWLVSFTVHLALILMLALWTWGAQKDASIQLEIAEIGDTQFDSMTMQIEFEDVTLEDNMDEMESTEFSESQMTFDVELEEAIPEVLADSVDPFAMTELPEFALPAAKAGGEANTSSSQAEAGKGAEQGAGAEFFGTKSYGSDFVFVIDASSSMINYYRWVRAVRELKTSLDQLGSDQNFLVLLYNNQAYMMFGAPADQKLIPATKENKKKISQWLQAAQPFGGTEPGEAMRMALAKKPDAIYFLSDGELRDNTMFNLRFWNKAAKGADGLMRKIPIHTILLGSNSGRLTMKTIAEENNGVFTAVN